MAAAGTRSHNLNYWDLQLVKFAQDEVPEQESLENKVDLLWQCILTALFPIEEDYVVVVRDRVAHKQPADAADIMVKHLRPDKTLRIIFTMENKRAQKQVAEKDWDQAAVQLERYFTIQRQSETGEGATRALDGAVAIGMRVQFWEYRAAGSRGKQQMHRQAECHVVREKEKIQKYLRGIKDKEEQISAELSVE